MGKWGAARANAVLTGNGVHQIDGQELLQSLKHCVHGGKGNKAVAEQKGQGTKTGKGTQRRAKRVHGKHLVGNPQRNCQAQEGRNEAHQQHI